MNEDEKLKKVLFFNNNYLYYFRKILAIKK